MDSDRNSGQMAKIDLPATDNQATLARPAIVLGIYATGGVISSGMYWKCHCKGSIGGRAKAHPIDL